MTSNQESAGAPASQEVTKIAREAGTRLWHFDKSDHHEMNRLIIESAITRALSGQQEEIIKLRSALLDSKRLIEHLNKRDGCAASTKHIDKVLFGQHVEKEVGQKCIACPVEVRDLYAVAFNLLNFYRPGQEERRERKLSEQLVELQRAVSQIQPFIDSHFENHVDPSGNETSRANTLPKEDTELLDILKRMYVKHHPNIDNEGWEKLSDAMQCVLRDTMGDQEFQLWIEVVTSEREGGEVK